MPAKRKIVLVPLCYLMILGVWIGTSSGHPLTKAECLRKCHPIQEGGLKTEAKVTPSVLISCYRQCFLTAKDHRTMNEKARNNRKRKSIQPSPEISERPGEKSRSAQWIPSKLEVTFGQYTNTNDWYINATWTPMNDSQGNWSNIYIGLNFHDSVEVHYFKLPKNQTFFTANISLYNYAYPDPIYLQVMSSPYTYPEPELHPHYPAPSVTLTSPSPSASHTSSAAPSVTLTSPSPSASHTSSATPSVVVNSTSPVVKGVAVSMGVLVGLALLVCAGVYVHYKKRRLRLPSDYPYDAFITFSYHDRVWARKLLHFLENKHHLKCCVHYRDFYAGRPFVENMAYSIDRSYKVIVVFSRNYLESNYCNYEMDLAINRLARERDGSLVVIRIDDVDPKNLPSELIGNSFIDCANYLERPFWKRRLLNFFRPALSVDSEQIQGRPPPLNRLNSTASNETYMSTV